MDRAAFPGLFERSCVMREIATSGSNIYRLARHVTYWANDAKNRRTKCGSSKKILNYYEHTRYNIQTIESVKINLTVEFCTFPQLTRSKYECTKFSYQPVDMMVTLLAV